MRKLPTLFLGLAVATLSACGLPPSTEQVSISFDAGTPHTVALPDWVECDDAFVNRGTATVARDRLDPDAISTRDSRHAMRPGVDAVDGRRFGLVHDHRSSDVFDDGIFLRSS